MAIDKFEVVSLLERALTSDITLDEATRVMAKTETNDDDILVDVIHYLIHFATDADLREDDPEYDKIMRTELQKRLAELRMR